MDTHVKERLTGAIILVGALVLLVPELLTGPKRAPAPAHAVTDDAPMRSYTIDLKDDANGSRTASPPAPNDTGAAPDVPEGAENGQQSKFDSATPDAAAVPDSTPASKPDSASAAQPPTAPSEEEQPKPTKSTTPAEDAPPVAKPAAQPTKTATSASEAGYSVQLGVFANRSNADRLASELKGKGFSASVSESKRGGRKLFRVRVGPEPDRASAQTLQARLRAIGRSGSVVSAR